ncbi:hypothetical protein DKM44_02530 [Deinococcus irradiatisoli]|uniref:LPS export ABC transporter periplasmic protein LptC n=1 Tax=Deinococcus irradiatisoli TaxID=2202254 RepID=A0A2Z3JFJ2_9DEIO|nr:hypothetical protein [Deinococcus irradiatisoli]AWN22251.1 hypothetical protein DKM44_02530 [Deinococcus irradiatisoli]
MLKWSALALAAMLVFGVVFALLPSAPSVRGSGVSLEEVKLRLYPAQDPGAEWRFAAQQIKVDPEKGETALDQLGRGERWVTGPRDQLHLDMTIKAQSLIIDNQDNLHARKAELYTLADCSTFTLSSSDQQQVIINQQGGYSAPRGRIRSPIYNGAFRNITANFDFSNFQAEQDVGAALDASPPTTCVNGQIQNR